MDFTATMTVMEGLDKDGIAASLPAVAGGITEPTA